MGVWRRLGVHHKRLGVVKGVRRRTSPQRLSILRACQQKKYDIESRWLFE